MTHLGLFEGVGGFSLAARWMGWETKAWCEWNEFGQQILKHHFPKAEGFGDISKTDFTKYADRIDILTGGFPCQDASIAKQDGEGQQGLQGARTGLFYEMCRAIREIKPKYVVAENVSNILKTNGGKDFRTILSELAGMGYNAEWRVCRASEVGSPHQRSRMYLVAYSNSIRLQERQTFFSNVHEASSQIAWSINGATVQTFRGGAWSSDPPVLLVDDGFPYNVVGTTISNWRRESIKAAGNAIVPQIAYKIFQGIQEYEDNLNN